MSDTLAGLTCQIKPQDHIPMQYDQPQDTIDQTDPLIGQENYPDEVILNVNDNDMSIINKDEFGDDNEIEIDMIKMSEKLEYQETSKRPYIFNNCIFKNATFN